MEKIMAMDKYLKNSKGHEIGRMVQRGPNHIYIYNQKGRELGTYKIKEDRTFDTQGRFIGTGNQLTTLL
jgi:hypothetical protein